MKRFTLLKSMMLLMLMMVSMGAWAADATLTFSEQGYANQQTVSSGTIDSFTSWSATDGTNSTAYYNTGSGLRIYNGGTFTVTSTKTIASITLTFSGTSYTFSTANTNTSQTVNPNATSYKWDVSRTCRLQKIEVTYDSGSGDTGGNSGSGDQGGGDDSGDTPAPSSIVKYVYEKVTSQSDIVAGETYIIVCEAYNTAMGSQSTNSRRNPANVSITANKIVTAVNDEGLPYEVTLEAQETYFAMSLSNNKYLGNGSGSSNQLKEVANYAAGYGWTLTYSSGTVSMKTNHASTQRYLCVNTSNADCYATYTAYGDYKKVTLYKKVGVATSVSAAGYATYYNAQAYTMPEGLQGMIMEENSINHAISATTIFNAGDVVPTGTALLLKGNEGEYPLVYTSEAADEDIVEYVESYNLLRGTLVETTTTGGNVYYKLAAGENGLGWYWGAEGGAAFTIGANKAYLALDAAVAASAKFISIIDETDGIESVKANIENNVIYNLNGQRVNANTKGIVIVNGKKYINK